MRRTVLLFHQALVWAALLVIMAGCSSSGSSGGNKKNAEHPDVALLDRLGQPIIAGSEVPYSPRKTCGECHDVDEIANGYHFQQGRTDLDGTIIVKDDYFGDGRSFVKSPGMYGKW